MNELNTLYKNMAESFGCAVKNEGQIMFTIGGKEIPITINGNQMYLPLSEVLDGNVIDKVFFHPACEHILSKETEVFKILRKMTVMSLLTRFNEIVPVIINVAKGVQKNSWKKNTLDMLNPLKGVTQKQRTEIHKLLTKATPVADNNGLDLRFIHFKMTKGGSRTSSSGERIYYKTVPTFPYYNELIRLLARSEGQPDNSQLEINGDSFSRASVKATTHLLSSIIPATLDPDDHSSESLKLVAARMVSYLGCYVDIADQLNRVVNTFRTEFNKAGIYALDTNWIESLDDLEDIYTQVPVLDYNGHNTKEETIPVNNHVTDDFFNVNVNTASNHNQVNNQVYNNQINNNVNTPQAHGFDTSPPQMEPGDRYIKTDIDHLQGRVIHHAINTVNNNGVRYITTRAGNLLQRIEDGGGMGMMNMGGGTGSLGGIDINALALLDPAMAKKISVIQAVNNPALDPFTRSLLMQQVTGGQGGMLGGAATLDGANNNSSNEIYTF